MSTRSVFSSAALTPAIDLRVERVGEQARVVRGDGENDRAGLTRRQRPRAGVGHVVELADGALDRLARRQAHVARLVDHPGRGGAGDPGEARDRVEGGRPYGLGRHLARRSLVGAELRACLVGCVHPS
jgi:hypothetical protein